MLTDAGIKIYTNLGPPLQDLAQINAQLLDGPKNARLVVSVLPSLAQTWLAPQLARLARLNSLAGIQTRIEEDPVDFARNNIDLRITYGYQMYADFDSRELFRDSVSPMCSPEFAAQHSQPGAELQALPDDQFIHVDWGVNYATHPGWSDWFRHQGVARSPAIAAGLQLSMSSAALDCASHGLGVVLGQRQLARNYLQQGRLVLLSEAALPLGQAYHAVYAHAGPRREQVLALLQGFGH